MEEECVNKDKKQRIFGETVTPDIELSKPLVGEVFCILSYGEVQEKVMEVGDGYEIAHFRDIFWKSEKTRASYLWKCFSKIILLDIASGITDINKRYRLKEHTSVIGRIYYTLQEVK